MELTRFDFTIIVAMTIAVILMSFTFAALGLTADPEAEEDDIPEFDIETERFDFRGDFPRRPGSPSSGVIWLDYTLHDDDGSAQEISDWQIHLEGDFENGVLLRVTDIYGSHQGTLRLIEYDDFDSNVQDEWNFTDVGQQDFVSGSGYTVVAESLVFDEQDRKYEVSWEIREQPDAGGGGLGSLPMIGFLFDGAEAVAGMVGWIGLVFLWGITWFFEIAFNLLGILGDAILFLGGMLLWLITTYSAIISTADSWASLFVAVPGVLLMIELGKVVLVFVAKLPTT